LPLDDQFDGFSLIYQPPLWNRDGHRLLSRQHGSRHDPLDPHIRPSNRILRHSFCPGQRDAGGSSGVSPQREALLYSSDTGRGHDGAVLSSAKSAAHFESMSSSVGEVRPIVPAFGGKRHQVIHIHLISLQKNVVLLGGVYCGRNEDSTDGKLFFLGR
jgi:hypothetical protein